MTPAALKDRLTGVIRSFTDTGQIPGIAYAVSIGGQVVSGCSGVTRWDESVEPVHEGTWFDLASLTKVVVTLPLCLELVGQNRWTWETRVSEVIHEASPRLGQVTVQQLLSHTSGLPSDLFLPENLPDNRDTLRERVLSSKPVDLLGRSAYSDVGMFLLGLMIERVRQEPLMSLAQRVLFGPLNVEFRDRVNPQLDSVAATRYCPVRNRVLQGEPQNLATHRWGSLTGHAGLFGQAEGVLQYGRAWLQDGRLLPWPETVTRAALQPQRDHRGYGWMLAGCSQFAPLVPWPSDTFGHTGFTGTALAVIPSRDMVCVLLSNRTHRGSFTESAPTIQRLRELFFATVLSN